MKTYSTGAKSFNTMVTPQNQPIPGSAQVPNEGGGSSFKIDKWGRLDRFLILGSEGGTYYTTEQKLTKDNAQSVIECIKADGPRTVARIVEISEAGRAPKNDPAIFALALACAYGNQETKYAVTEALNRVCRIGTHILHFAEFVSNMCGWGRGLRGTIAHWYTSKTAADLAYQAVKYGQRDGWSHRDLFRLSHPVPSEGIPDYDSGAALNAQALVFNWIVKGWSGVGPEPHPDKALQIIWAAERAKTATLPELLKLISTYNLPREAIPTQWLTNADVWAALLPHMGLTALIRNLATMTKIELLSNGDWGTTKAVIQKIDSAENLKKAMVHPIAILAALLTYKQGHGVRGGSSWTPVPAIVDALDSAFYKAFGNVVPTGKRTLLALDVSGSMTAGEIAGVPGLTPRMGTAAMALVTAKTEPSHMIMGFSAGFIPLDITPRHRLDTAMESIANLPFQSTDCSLPMTWALKNKKEIDTFVIYTDSETNHGNIHPVQALQQYRNLTGIPAKLVVVGMTANEFTIADKNDNGMVDVCGFDTATPQLISDFSIGSFGS